MMTLHSLRNHRNTHHQTRWIEGKWDLTLQMMWYNWMLYHPVWLIEVEEDLLLTPFSQLYQSTRMMVPIWNTTHRTQWIQEKWDLTLQMILYSGMHNHPVWLIEVGEVLRISSLTQSYQSKRMSWWNWNNSHQSQPFQALPTLSIQRILLIEMPCYWYWTTSMPSHLPHYSNNSWLRFTTTEGAL